MDSWCFWLPIFLIKPVLIGVLAGAAAWLVIRFFQLSRPLAPTEVKTFKIVLVILTGGSAAAGVIKIVRGAGR